MTIKDLHKKLIDLKVPSDDYYLHGLYGSDSDDNKLGLTTKIGKYTIEYEVYYRERGEKHTVRLFTNESEACEHFLDRILESITIEKARNVVGLKGMTVNERLFATGLMDEFDQAKKKNKKRAAQILRILGVDNNSISKILSIILILFAVNNLFCQTTIVIGKIGCHSVNKDCCFNCPMIWNQQDSISIETDKNGYFQLEFDKKEGDFTLCISTIGSYNIWIEHIPYFDTIKFETIELIDVDKITISKYKRIERQTYRSFDSKVKAREFMTNNFGFIQPFGTPAYYLDSRELPTDFISNPLDNSKRIAIQNLDDKTIRIDYNMIQTK